MSFIHYFILLSVIYYVVVMKIGAKINIFQVTVIETKTEIIFRTKLSSSTENICKEQNN